MPGTGAPHVQTHEKGASCSATHLAPLELNVGLRPLATREEGHIWVTWVPTHGKQTPHKYIYMSPHIHVHTSTTQVSLKMWHSPQRGANYGDAMINQWMGVPLAEFRRWMGARLAPFGLHACCKHHTWPRKQLTQNVLIVDSRGFCSWRYN